MPLGKNVSLSEKLIKRTTSKTNKPNIKNNTSKTNNKITTSGPRERIFSQKNATDGTKKNDLLRQRRLARKAL